MKEDKNQKALDYIKKFTERLNENFKVEAKYIPYNYLILINNSFNIRFSESLLEDFEVALEKHKPSSYFNALESSIKFHIYMELNNKNLLEKHTSKVLICNAL